MTPSVRRALMTLPLLPLAGCVDNPASRYFEWQRHAQVVEFAPEPLYCYRSLGQATCYAKPLDRRENDRIINYYGPAPGRVAIQMVPPPRDKDKMGEVIDHPPIMAPRDQVEVEVAPLPAPGAPPPPPASGAPIPLKPPTATP